MRVADLENLTGMQWDLDSPAAEDCIVATLVGYGVWAQASGDIIEIIWVSERGVAITEEGVRVGDPERLVLEAYGERASVEQGDASETIIVVDSPLSVDYSYIFSSTTTVSWTTSLLLTAPISEKGAVRDQGPYSSAKSR